MSASEAFTLAPSRNAEDASHMTLALSAPDWRPLAGLRFGDAASEFARLLVDRRGYNAPDEDFEDDDFDEEDLDEEDEFLEDDFEDEELDDEDLEDEDFDDLEDEEFEDDDLEDER